MQKEKISAILLVIIILVALFSYIAIKENLFGPKTDETKTVQLGDCVDLHYIGKFPNGTIFDSSYDDPENETGGILLNVYVTRDPDALPPTGYDDYMAGMIEGFIDGIIGLKEGEEATIGPIPPEEGYGRPPEIGDEITFSFLEEDQVLIIIDIKYDVAMPSDFISFLGDFNTTVLTLKSKVEFEVGQKFTLYSPWENATEYTFINETTVSLYTTPPDDKMSNFTWVNLTLGIEYWEDASSVTSINDTTIIIQHNPKIGDTMISQSTFGDIMYTVVNISSDKINCSYQNPYTGETHYDLFDRIEKIQRNETQSIVFDYPLEALEYTVYQFINHGIDVDYSFSFSPLAGETLYFDVVIEKLYKTSNS